jgi:hypothetical protein
VSRVILPRLVLRPTRAMSTRRGHEVDLVVLHRWGVKFINMPAEARSYQGVVNYFLDPKNKASSHIVFPGSAVPGEATQMVGWSEMAWTEAAFNPYCDEIECADAIWLGDDPIGLSVLARIVAFRLHVRNLPAVWSNRRGFCRHADLGVAGGGHLECPTTDISLWRYFVSLVETEVALGDFRPKWGWD